MSRFLSGLSLCLLFSLLALAGGSPAAFAQTPQLGIPPYSTITGNPDDVSLSNLSIHYTIPVFSRPGRGAPFRFAINFDNVNWSVGANGMGLNQWQAFFPLTGGGLNGIGAVFYTRTSKTCKLIDEDTTITFNIFYFNSFQDARGTTHPFGSAGVAVSDLNPDIGPGCNAFLRVYPPTKSGTASDGSGITINASGSPLAATVTTPHGDVIKPPLLTYINYAWSVSGAPPYTSTDSNGNQVTETWQSGTLHLNTITDNLGTAAVTSTGIYPASVKYKYTAPSGAAAYYTMSFVQYTVETSFHCANVLEFPPTAIYLRDKITLPDTSYYKFTYETYPTVIPPAASLPCAFQAAGPSTTPTAAESFATTAVPCPCSAQPRMASGTMIAAISPSTVRTG
ncbi:MAG: hypothetical protein LAN63_11180 [Acidobacteriia bacterium]|nr:hypothetical protein [Terriglobia bacterium]